MGPDRQDVEQWLQADLARLGTGPVAPVDAVAQDVRRRMARRRRRRVGAVASVAAVVVIAGVWAASGSPPVDVTTADDPADASDPEGPAPSRPVSVIGVVTGVRGDGGQRVSVQLDGPVPDEPVTFVEDITDPRSPGVGYTTQGPSGLHVCGDRHWLPGEVGSVDVLLPAEWLVPGSPDADMRLTTTDFPGAPGKVVACGPTRGYVQYSIWGATSDDPADVQVRVESDDTGSSVIVDIAASG